MNSAKTSSPASALPESVVSFVLSAVSGFVDTAGFILLAGIFTSHVTGNLVLAGAAIAGHVDGGVRVRLALLVVLMFSVAAASALARWAEKKSLPVVSVLLGAEAIMLGGFLYSGLEIAKYSHPFSEGNLLVIAGCAVTAMGIQNALMREGLKSYLPTTMMTGNTTQFTLDWFSLVTGRRAEETRPRLRRTAIVLAGFLSGAALGAFAVAVMRMWSPAIPVCAIALLTILTLPGGSKGPA